MTYPDNYKPVAYCRTCGRDFAGDTYFDRHRVGDHELTYPEHENGRRCATDLELIAKGLHPMTDEEMRAGRNGKRVGYGIELWFDPELAQDARERLREPVYAL